MLMKATLKEIGAGVRVKCENRSMDELRDEPLSTREVVEETTSHGVPPSILCAHCMMLLLAPLQTCSKETS